MVEVNEKIKSVILNKEFLISADISEIRGQVNLITTVNPVRITSDQKVERLLRYRVEVTTENLVTPNLRNPESTFTSVLSSGDIYKISVEKSGVYKIDRTFLEMKLGIDVSKINPKKIKAVSYTHLDVYKRQAMAYKQTPACRYTICLLYTSRCV